MSLLISGSALQGALSQNESGLPAAVLGEVTGSDKSGQTEAKPESPSESKGQEGDSSKTASTEKEEPDTETVSTAAPLPIHQSAPEKTEGPPHLEKELPRVARPAGNAAKPSSKPLVLFGRIEEISSKSEPSFPIVLKALTPKMDRAPLLKGEASAGTLAGSVVRSYPADFRGTWGGTLQLAQLQIDPLNYQIDPDEVQKTQSILQRGTQGTVNFTFTTDGQGQTYVEPAKIVFMVPFGKTNQSQQLSQMLQGQQGAGAAPMAGMMSQMMSTMKVPAIMSFGNTQSSALTPGISGNQFTIKVLSNRIKQLAPGVMEQQIINQEDIDIKGSGRRYGTYNENVFRFTERGRNQLYVELASVSYAMDRRFLRKMVFYGYVNRGAVQQDYSNPYAGIQQLLGPGSGIQLPSGTSPYGGASPYGGNPYGANPYGGSGANPFGNLFGPGNNPLRGLFGQ